MRETPVPIPNTEVKPRRAYGTAVLAVGESVNAKIEVMIARFISFSEWIDVSIKK